MKKRKLAVLTGTRSEYGILKPLLREIKLSKNLELMLIVTGMHLLEKHGFTVNEIKKDGFKINKTIKMYFGNERNSEYYGKGLGRGVENFTKTLFKTKPDFLIVFGDRLEAFAGVLAAATLKIPIGHIHAGDKTDSGHIDESIRHSIARFAHIHFTPTEKCKERLIKTGEESWRVYNVGALNIDSILNVRKIKKDILFKKLNLNSCQKTILCIFNPVHLESKTMGRQMAEIIKALKELKIQTVIIYPNNDAGSRNIIAEIKKAQKLSFIKTFPNLSHLEYISLLKYADTLIGNSSSGIIEAPSIKLPVVNIGLRNTGREHGENIIFISADKNKIIKAVKKALFDKIFLAKVKKCRNPYGNGGAGNRIIKIFKKIKINKKLLQKKITY